MNALNTIGEIVMMNMTNDLDSRLQKTNTVRELIIYLYISEHFVENAEK